MVGLQHKVGGLMKKDMTENEKKKEFLNSYLTGKRGVKRLEEQIAELRLNKISPGCVMGDGMPHAHDPSDLSVYAARLDELEQKLWAERYHRINAYMQVQNAIEQMRDEREKMLLTYRYLNGYGWERIAVEMEISWRHTLRLHGNALKNFEMS